MEVKVQVEKKQPDWKASVCKECEKPFISKKALRNHMRLANHREKSHGK